MAGDDFKLFRTDSLEGIQLLEVRDARILLKSCTVCEHKHQNNFNNILRVFTPTTLGDLVSHPSLLAPVKRKIS